MRKLIWLVGLFFFPCLLCASPPPTARSILAQSKAASGGDAWNQVHSINLEGKASTGGLSGPFEQLEDVNTGASLLQYKLGAFEERSGFDGTISWKQGPNGDVALQGSAAGKQTAAAEAYLTARAYWFPKRWPATIQLLGTRTVDGRTYQVLRALPRGGDAVELWIDTSTHLIKRIVEMTGGAGQTQVWSGYRAVDGIKVPFRVEVYNGNDVEHASIATVDHAQVNVDIPADRFAPPKQELNDFAFIDGGNSASIPIQVINNHIYLPVTINHHVLHFMLDTGGRNLLTPEAAAKAGVESVGALAGGGVGNKVVNAGLAKVAETTVGKLVLLRNQSFNVEPLPHFGQIEGTEFDGLIGYEVLKRLVTRIDYTNRTVTFIRPSDFSSTHAGQSIPFTFFGSTPIVSGSLDGLSAQFEIDTGSRAGLTLWTPFVKAHHLIKRYEASAKTTIGWGVGGNVVGRAARGGEFMLDGIKILSPVLTMQNSAGSPNSFKGVDGNIGGAILRRFTVTFDYNNHKLYLRPNRDCSQPFNYDRSGMWINQAAGGFKVESLLAGGPAAAAGLQVGDVIMTIDDTPVDQMALSDWRRSLRKDPSGTRIHLEVRRKNATQAVTIVLRDLIPRIWQATSSVTAPRSHAQLRTPSHIN